MLKSEMLLSILLPEVISDLGNNNIREIKRRGKRYDYILNTMKESKFFYGGKSNVTSDAGYMIKKIHELSKSNDNRDLNNVGKNLLQSEIRFANEQKLLDFLNDKNITIEDIEELNNLVREYQYNYSEYSLNYIKLEKKYNLKVTQAEDILNIIMPTLKKENYVLNNDDLDIYNDAKKMIFTIKLCSKKTENSIRKLNNNGILNKLISLGKDHFGLDNSEIFILINKINELYVSCPNNINKDNSKIKTIVKK